MLAGRTRGYRHHPQLGRFSDTPDPAAAIGAYLSVVADEASSRSYSFDRTKIDHPPAGLVRGLIEVATGQLEYERQHLAAKLDARSPDWLAAHPLAPQPEAHPLFVVVPGNRADWEVVTGRGGPRSTP